MKRKAAELLSNWLLGPGRKPLVMRGARQVGKTYLVRQLAKEHDLDLIEFNFEKYPEHKSFFASNDVQQILTLLETQQNKAINVNRSLLFLDEIQAAPELLAKLRWFAEDLPELAVIATGSLLDFVLNQHNFSMPVGRIGYFHLEPLTFEEFLIACGRDKLVDYLAAYKLNTEIPLALHQQLLTFLREYFLIGGLPAAVATWVESKSLLKVSQIQQDLLATYRDDFNKYGTRVERERLELLFNAVPRQLGAKFVYSNVSKDIQSASLKKALTQLELARICHKVANNTAEGIPLAAGKKLTAFKVIFLDTGLANALMGLNVQKLQAQSFELMHEGGMAEQFVGQMLRSLNPYFMEPDLNYWIREQKTSNAEIDYIIQHGAHLIPIEVKAGRTGTLKSLHLLMGLRGFTTAVRFNTDFPSLTPVDTVTALEQKAVYNLLSLPLYLIGQTQRLLDECIF